MNFVSIDKGRIELYLEDFLPIKFDPDVAGAVGFIRALEEACGDEVNFMASSSVDNPEWYGIPGFDLDAWVDLGYREINVHEWARDIC